MLLFSTMLDIKQTMVEKDFIRLLIEANQKNEHKVNVIPEEEIQWDENSDELEYHFGNDELSLDTRKFFDGNIMMARFEKKEPDGQNWRTDYVWNLNDGKMAINLSRNHSENSPAKKKFYPPSFIGYLIREGFLENDGDLPMSESPILIKEDNISLLASVVNGKVNYRFPIVYVSKKFGDNKDPVDINELAERLRGVAHLFVQEDNTTAVMIASQCEDKFTFDGAVTIYYPYQTYDMKTINRNHKNELKQEKFIEKILNLVLNYTNGLELPPYYTWGSVNRQILQAKSNHRKTERDKALTAANEANELVNSTSDEIDQKDTLIADLSSEKEELQDTVNRKDATIDALRSNIKSLKEKNDITRPEIRLFIGEKEEYFEDEAKEIVLDALNAVLNNYKDKRLRRYDVIKSIIDGNEKPDNMKKRHEEVKRILKGFRSPTSPVDRELKKLGITFDKDGSDHPQYIYHDNPRYKAVLMSSGEDVRGGMNLAEEINKAMF